MAGLRPRCHRHAFDTPMICVTLHGRNLSELHCKLLKHEVEWVMEYDPRRWPAPSQNAPRIAGIEITQDAAGKGR